MLVPLGGIAGDCRTVGAAFQGDQDHLGPRVIAKRHDTGPDAAAGITEHVSVTPQPSGIAAMAALEPHQHRPSSRQTNLAAMGMAAKIKPMSIGGMGDDFGRVNECHGKPLRRRRQSLNRRLGVKAVNVVKPGYMDMIIPPL